jgi:hypothetical protein
MFPFGQGHSFVPPADGHIRIHVGEECLLPVATHANEYFFLFSKSAVNRLNKLKPQLPTAAATQRGRGLDEGTYVISFGARRTLETTDPDLRVETSGSDIVITMPGTSYTVTYYRAAGSRQLLAKSFPMKDDPRVAMTVSEFLIRAWKLANNKASALGWMV